MRIGIDCRMYGPSHGYMGKYMECFLSYLEQNEDTNEYVLFFNDRELGDFTSESSRFRTIKTSAKIGGIAEQILFPYELFRERMDVVFFPSPNIPLLYRKKAIITLSDLVPYFYPEKRLKGAWMRYWHRFILRNSIQRSHSIIVFSEMLGRDIIEIFDTHEDKIQVISPMCPNIPETKSGESEIKQFLLQEGINEKYMLSV